MTDTNQCKVKKRAAVVRGGLWNTTPAVTRTISTLKRLGYTVDVLYWDTLGISSDARNVPGCSTHRYTRRIPPGSPLYFLCWPLWWMWLFQRFREGDYVLLHTMNLDSVVPGLFCKLFYDVKVVYDIRDAWGLCLTTKPFPIPQSMTILDRMAARRVDGILLSQGCLDVCAQYFGTRVVRKIPAIQVLNVPEKDHGRHFRQPACRPLTINFCGNVSSIRGGYILADVVEGDARLRLDVFGLIKDDQLKKRLQSLQNVTVTGPLPHQESLERMDSADVISILYDPALKVVGISSANKMFEAMMLGKPYVCTKDTFPAMVAERFGLGWALPYGDVEATKSLLEDLLSAPQKVIEAGLNGRNAYELHFRWELQQQNLIILYESLMDRARNEEREVDGWSRFLGSCVSLAN